MQTLIDASRSTSPRSARATSSGDRETRARLLDAGARLFAERGFAPVTVRDICRRARANVAAVNYHFGGKHDLYTAVMQSAIQTMQATTEAARTAGEGQAPEERLRTYVRVFVERLMGLGHDTWIHQLMMRELADPTPALDMVVEQVLKPRMTYLCGTIGELIGLAPDDLRVVRCAISVQSQFHTLVWNQVLPGPSSPPGTGARAFDAVADHIAQFSLAGARGLIADSRLDD